MMRQEDAELMEEGAGIAPRQYESKKAHSNC